MEESKKKELARLITERNDFLEAFMQMLGMKTRFFIKTVAWKVLDDEEVKPNSVFKDANYLWAAKWVREDAERTLKNLEQ